MTVIEKKVSSFDGTEIFYQVKGSGEPLLLLHGNGGSSNYFHEQMALFSQEYLVIAIDSRDHGKSGNNDSELSFEMMAEDVWAVCREEELTSVGIVGFSDGANLGMTFAVRYPEMVSKLVLNSANLEPAGLRWYFQFPVKLGLGLCSLLAGVSRQFSRLRRWLSLINRPLEITWEELKKIKCQTLVIVGQHDIIKRTHTKKIAAALPKAKLLIISQGTHDLARKKVNEFNDSILVFFKQEAL